MDKSYSYRDDPTVPKFDDSKPLFVFDGVCVLCSTGVRWFLKYGGRGKMNFATAQTGLGQAIYQHYKIPVDDTYLLIDQGRIYTKSSGYLQMLDMLGGGWKLFKIFHILPRSFLDWGYDILARNRYQWFGKSGYCELIPAADRPNVLS